MAVAACFCDEGYEFLDILHAVYGPLIRIVIIDMEVVLNNQPNTELARVALDHWLTMNGYT
jgi:hypothetical protein